MPEPIAHSESLSFGYRRRPVLRELTVEIGPGITGLLGPNGAGKTTFMSLLATRRTIGSGRLSVLGHDTSTQTGRAAVRRQIGLLLQRYPLVGSMRVEDTIAYAAWAHGLTQVDCYRAAARTIERLSIGDLSRRRVRSLSGGQRQRVGLATAMVHEPRLLILDEPTAGLDPEVRMAMRRALREAAASASILLSTHLVDDVVALCDTIVVLDQGRLVFKGSPAALAAHARDAEHSAAGSSDAAGSAMERGYETLLIQGRSRAS